MAEYKRKDMPEDMIVRISPGRNTITVQECSANGVVSYREIDPIEFYFALNGSCISNVYQRSGFLPEHCLHISMNAEERHYVIWNPELRADVIYRDTEYRSFPLPRLIFGLRVLGNGKVADCSMGVVADETPTEDTPMFFYPFSNVYEDDRVCTGNNVLPPLSVLYENARSTPSLQILEKEKLLQKKLLSKEKRNWLGFIQAGGSASYGIADNVASNTDVNTPLIYRYVGTEQTSWNVGGGISIPFEKLFDLRGGIKRQRIQVDIAELRKQEAYETLKIQIAHLYVQILSNIETLQRSAENIALYKGASAVAEQEYRNRRTSIHDVAKTKEQEFAANQDFALLRSTINDQLLTLEIISHTPILTIQGEKDVQETTIQEQEENKRQSKKKDKKE